MSETVGFIGLGAMGLPIARNLADAGYALRVFNRTAAKAAPLVERGARQTPTPAEVAESGAVVFTMLSDDRAAESVVMGGLAERLAPGGVHVSMSTISPATARRLADRHASAGSVFVAAPVFGRPDAAAARRLWICTSGPAAAKARVEPMLKAAGQALFDFGEDAGAANSVKVIGNFVIAAALETLSEALVLAEKSGLDPGAVAAMLGKTIFACPVYQGYGRVIAERRFAPPGFTMPLGYKDVGLVLGMAESVRMPMPVASVVRDRFTAALANGGGQLDWSAIALEVARAAGLPR